jgi:uncharacterized protein YbcV (DUF1398 family)
MYKDDIVVRTIDHAVAQAHVGQISFGELVLVLEHVGVESYCADFRTTVTTYYLLSGSHYRRPLETPATVIAEEFDPPRVQAMVCLARRGGIRYPKLLTLLMDAGCVGYTVWINGRHGMYFGRRGEVHTEYFSTNS